MISRPVAAALLALTCTAAAGTGAYMAVRDNTAVPPSPAMATPPAPDVPKAVQETEAVIARPDVKPEVTTPELQPGVKMDPVESAPAAAPSSRPAAKPTARPAPRRGIPASSRVAQSAEPKGQAPPAAAAAASPSAGPEGAAPVPNPPAVEPERPEDIPPVPETPRFEEVVVPASSVIGLQVETALSSERARVEDRVDARVTRDVMAGGRVAIPAGSRVIGAVTLVEKGGKMKERARLGVRFHTLVLADGLQVPLRTESIVREGEAPSGESARKIGGAAIGGAILGAIMGGGKGAALGGAAGAGAGTAAVMAGDRNAATLSAGTIVTARLASPVTLELERR